MEKKICPCGCGKPVIGNKKRKWASDACRQRGFKERAAAKTKLDALKKASIKHCTHCGEVADLSLKMGNAPLCKNCWKKYIWMPEVKKKSMWDPPTWDPPHLIRPYQQGKSAKPANTEKEIAKLEERIAWLREEVLARQKSFEATMKYMCVPKEEWNTYWEDMPEVNMWEKILLQE